MVSYIIPYEGCKNNREVTFSSLKLISAGRFFYKSCRYIFSNIENNITLISVMIKSKRIAKSMQRKLRCWKSLIEFSFRYPKDVNVSTNHGSYLPTFVSQRIYIWQLQFLANESLLKMMKSAFDFTLNIHFVIEIFRFLF